MSEHICHATGCTTPCEPRHIMCGRHWAMVPKALRDELYGVYRPGQEVTKDPTLAYLQSARKVIKHVAATERRRAR